MLYALRHYSLPVLLAFAIHAALVLFLWQGVSSQASEERIIKPKVINSTLLVLEPTEAKARAQAPPPSAQPEPVVAPDKVDPRLLEDQRRQREETRRKQVALERDKKRAEEKKREEDEKLAREENERVRAAAERDRAVRLKEASERAKAERQARLDALSTSSVASDEKTAAEEAEGAEAALAQTFFQRIRSKIVANWSRPASARNGMKVTLRVELVPGGEVTAVSLVTSSGDAAFDRSAESAIRRSGRFDVPEDSAIFERRFRRFNLLFNPEDLLR